jgi:hypothetical protein
MFIPIQSFQTYYTSHCTGKEKEKNNKIILKMYYIEVSTVIAKEIILTVQRDKINAEEVDQINKGYYFIVIVGIRKTNRFHHRKL